MPPRLPWRPIGWRPGQCPPYVALASPLVTGSRRGHQVEVLRSLWWRCAHLSLAVGPGPPQGALFAHVGDAAIQRVRQNHRQRHTLLSLVRGVPEHQTLAGR